MTRMKTGVVAALSAVVLLGGAALAGGMRQGDESPQPWLAGRCYRITILDPEQQHDIRVVESPRGPWVRVHSDPILPRVPGTNPRNYLWLNTASVFTVQQIACTGV
jgi:hypothetical protein